MHLHKLPGNTSLSRWSFKSPDSCFVVSSYIGGAILKICISYRKREEDRYPFSAQFVLRSATCILNLSLKNNMAEFVTLEEELKQEEYTASVKSETEDTPEETPNGVKP